MEFQELLDLIRKQDPSKRRELREALDSDLPPKGQRVELTVEQRVSLRNELEAARRRPDLGPGVAMESFNAIATRVGDRLWAGRGGLVDELVAECNRLRAEADAQAGDFKASKPPKLVQAPLGLEEEAPEEE